MKTLSNNPIHLYVLFIILLFLPVSQNIPRILLFLIFSLICLARIALHGRLNYSRWSFIGTIVTVMTGTLWFLLGFILDNPGALFLSSIYIIWPILYVFFSNEISSIIIVKKLHKIILLFSILLSLFVLNYILHVGGFPSITPLHNIDLGQGYAIHDGYTEMRLYSLSSLIFTLPYLIVHLFVNFKNSNIKSNLFTLIAIIGSIFISIVAGRRALLLNLILIPLIFWIIYPLISKSTKVKLSNNVRYILIFSPWILLSIAIIIVIFGLDNFLPLLNYVKSAFQPSQDEAAQIRIIQSKLLISGWLENPLFGNGMGAATSYVRSNIERPWEYEMQYQMYLFQFGIIGFSIYASAIFMIFLQGIKAIRTGDSKYTPYVIASLAGLLSFLIANISNPYLQAFGHLWVIFLPIGIINLALRDK